VVWIFPCSSITSLHVHKVRVSCAVSACRIIGPVFFSETVNTYCYFWLILAPFLSKLTEEENVYSYFIQDFTLTDTADFSVAALEDVFSIQIIICKMLPPRFPDMNLSYYYLWGISKGRSCMNSTHSLQDIIQRESSKISRLNVQDVPKNIHSRCEACLEAGQHFDIFIWNKWIWTAG